MKDELFTELVASVREGGAILRGESAPARAFVVDRAKAKGVVCLIIRPKHKKAKQQKEYFK